MKALAILVLLVIGCGEPQVGYDTPDADPAGTGTGGHGATAGTGGADGTGCADQWECGETDTARTCYEDTEEWLTRSLPCPSGHGHNTHGTLCVYACQYGFNAADAPCKGQIDAKYVYCSADYKCSECTDP